MTFHINILKTFRNKHFKKDFEIEILNCMKHIPKQAFWNKISRMLTIKIFWNEFFRTFLYEIRSEKNLPKRYFFRIPSLLLVQFSYFLLLSLQQQR